MQICENNKDCYYKQKTADLLQEVDIARYREIPDGAVILGEIEAEEEQKI